MPKRLPGYFDPLTIPVGPVLTRALQEDLYAFETSCTVLSTIAAHGGREAGVFLLGLLSYYRDRLDRLGEVARALGSFSSKATADALLSEIKRVKPSNATRRYIVVVLRAIERLPREFWQEQLLEIAYNAQTSPRWRRRFEAALWPELE